MSGPQPPVPEKMKRFSASTEGSEKGRSVAQALQGTRTTMRLMKGEAVTKFNLWPHLFREIHPPSMPSKG
jgi:hypothetical protein